MGINEGKCIFVKLLIEVVQRHIFIKIYILKNTSMKTYMALLYGVLTNIRRKEDLGTFGLQTLILPLRSLLKLSLCSDPTLTLTLDVARIER